MSKEGRTAQIIKAIQLVEKGIRWKPNSASRHLLKRKRRGHLPEDATLADYEYLIRHIVQDTCAKVYLFWYETVSYVTIVSIREENTWLVMFSMDGIMETAFVVERPDKYLSSPDYEYIGSVSEVIHHGL